MRSYLIIEENENPKEYIMLSENDERVFSLFAALVRRKFPDASIWAFGSRTRSTAAEDSDLDVCVVVDLLDDDVDRAIMDVAWEVGFDNDVVISTITYSRQEFEQGPCSESALVRAVLDLGVAA